MANWVVFFTQEPFNGNVEPTNPFQVSNHNHRDDFDLRYLSKKRQQRRLSLISQSLAHLNSGRGLATIQDLPAEMVNIILKNLDHSTKKQGRLVCKQWQELIDKTIHFRAVLCADTIKYVQNTKQELQELIAVNLTGNRYIPTLYTTVKNLTFGCGVLNSNISRILKFKLENTITSLTFDHLALSAGMFDGEFLATLNLASLIELRLIIIPTINFREESYILHVDGMVNILTHLTAPNLKSLKGEFNANGDSIHSKPTAPILSHVSISATRYLLNTFLKFAIAHHASLSDLKTEFVARSSFGPSDLNLSGLSNLRLKSFELKSDSQHFPQLQQIPATLTGLEKLIIERSFVNFPLDGEEFDGIIGTHSPTLQTLKLGLVVFNSKWIENCKNLKTLELKIIAHHGQNPEFVSICLPLVEDFTLNYIYPGQTGPTSEVLFWIKDSFPNLKKLELEFTLNFISTHSIVLLALGLKRLETIVLVQQRPVSDHPDWNFIELCTNVPGITLRTMNLTSTKMFYDFSIERKQLEDWLQLINPDLEVA